MAKNLFKLGCKQSTETKQY